MAESLKRSSKTNTDGKHDAQEAAGRSTSNVWQQTIPDLSEAELEEFRNDAFIRLLHGLNLQQFEQSFRAALTGNYAPAASQQEMANALIHILNRLDLRELKKPVAEALYKQNVSVTFSEPTGGKIKPVTVQSSPADLDALTEAITERIDDMDLNYDHLKLLETSFFALIREASPKSTVDFNVAYYKERAPLLSSNPPDLDFLGRTTFRPSYLRVIAAAAARRRNHSNDVKRALARVCVCLSKNFQKQTATPSETDS